MSSRRGSNNSNSGSANPLPKDKGVQSGSSGGSSINNSSSINQLSHNVADMSLGSAQDDGDWEVISKKSKSRTGAAKPWGPPPQSSTPKAWGKPDSMQKLGTIGHGGAGKAPGGAWQAQTADTKRNGGRGIVKPQSANRAWENAHAAPPAYTVPPTYTAPSAAVPPPLQHGWNWAARAGSSQPQGSNLQGRGNNKTHCHQEYAAGDDSESEFSVSRDQDDVEDDDDGDDDALVDSDDDLMDDDFDSDDSVKSHGTRKQNRWFIKWFEVLDKLNNDQISEASRQWHCPACAGGPGAINWYRGLQPLMAHAKTKGAQRVKLHREFAELLDEELYRRGTSVIPSGEAFGKWEGLRERVKDHEIVWPPMVMIMNTKLEQDENEKWIGMGNQELLDYFSQYRAVKARHSYGPQGHRGISLLIFEASAMGYREAERLNKHFSDQRTDRDAWNQPGRRLFYPGGKRQLYGFMACKEDLDVFNQHSQGKARLKFEMQSYLEKVDQPLKQMNEDNQLVHYYKTRAEKEQRHSKALIENYEQVADKYRKAIQENRIVRERTKMQHEQNKEEMDYQEKFFREQMDALHQGLEDEERAFEERHQEQRKRVQEEAKADIKSNEEYEQRMKELEKFIQNQDKGVAEFLAEREKLIKEHEDQKMDMVRRHMEEEVKLEEEFKSKLTSLMGQYAPRPQLSKEGESLK